MKEKRLKRKGAPTTRQRNWRPEDDATFSGDRKRHRSLRPDATIAEAIEGLFTDGLEANGTVISAYGALAWVEYEGAERLCEVNKDFLLGRSSILAPGDAVFVEIAGDKALVRSVATRRSKLGRLAIGQEREQVIAANVDRLVIVAAAAQPMFKPGFVDRCLVAAHLGGVEPVLCVNKIDLVEAEPEAVASYRDAGIRVIAASCVTGQGIDELRETLAGGLTVLAGQSGVGKSSIINALDPALQLPAQEVSGYNEKGRHTTTAGRIHTLAGGIRVIDTPGIRQLGLWGVTAEELTRYFPELDRYAMECRFRDCTHTQEPGCAVAAAVENGDVPRARYASYLRIRDDLRERAEKNPGA